MLVRLARRTMCRLFFGFDCNRCQRKKGVLGKGLGKTTGWIHRTSLKKHGETLTPEGCSYLPIFTTGSSTFPPSRFTMYETDAELSWTHVLCMSFL